MTLIILPNTRRANTKRLHRFCRTVPYCSGTTHMLRTGWLILRSEHSEEFSFFEKFPKLIGTPVAGLASATRSELPCEGCIQPGPASRNSNRYEHNPKELHSPT